VTSPIISGSTTADAGRPTAEIIPFPSRPNPVMPQPELARALEALNAAMLEQRAAVAAWRAALGELKASTSGLGESLQRYQSNLQSLGNSVSALQSNAQSLEQWADGVAAD
jgi:chromosome segregation ATPase